MSVVPVLTMNPSVVIIHIIMTINVQLNSCHPLSVSISTYPEFYGVLMLASEPHERVGTMREAHSKRSTLTIQSLHSKMKPGVPEVGAHDSRKTG